MTAVFLNTRGRERHRDYQFIGPAPPSAWWRAYADHTTFERPTVLVQSDGRSWQAYLSGIPSRRRDVVGTVIRYTVIAEGARDQPVAGELGPGHVLALIANWLADQELGRGAGRVSAALDAAFPEADVERLLAVDPGGAAPTAAAEVRRRLAGALHDLRPPDPTGAEPVPGMGPADRWLADLGRPAAQAAFVQLVGTLVAGQPGRALVLNLIGGAADLGALTDGPGPLAVLAPDLPEPAETVPLNREPAKKAVAPPGTNDPESAAPPRPAPRPTLSATVHNLRGCLRLIMVPIALLVALALALFGTLFYLR